MAEIKRSFKTPDIIPGRVIVIFTDNMAETIKKLDPEEEHPDSFIALCDLDRPGRPKIILHVDATLGPIVHESSHAAFDLLKFAGIPVTYDDNEAFCYLLEYVVNKIMKLQEKINGQRTD